MKSWEEAFEELPLIAILRGLSPGEAVDVVDSLYAEGFRVIEVPLNSPDPFDSIARLCKVYGKGCLIGAGTVLDPADVQRVYDAGGRLIVAPNVDQAVAAKTIALGMSYCPGVQTPTEALQALALGADAIKLFPAEAIPPSVAKALHAVLPPGTRTIPVGGINPDSMAAYLAAGVSGFGLGSGLYKPGRSLPDIQVAAREYVEAFASARGSASEQ